MPVRTRHVIVLLVVTMTAVLVPRFAAACTCMGKRPVCEAAWDPGAVFAGKVVAIEQNAGGDLFANRRVRFQVVEAFRGVATKEIDVYTGAGGGDCGYSFIVGASYLVYAYQEAARLTTGICSRTQRLAGAAEDLAYLRNLPENGALGATILGTVYDRDRNISREPGSVQLGGAAGLRIAVNCEGLTFSATTDPDGRFKVEGVPVGQCTARLENSDYQLFPHSPATVTDPRACAALTLQVSRAKR